MKCFDIDAVESALCREFRRRNVGVLQSIQFLVRNKRMVRRNIVRNIQNAAVVSKNRSALAANRLAVTARMRQLEDRYDFMTVRVFGKSSRPLLQSGKGIDAFFVDPKLSCVGPCFRRYGGRLEPEQPGSASREPLVTSETKFRRLTVGTGIEAFHRLDHKTVRQRECSFHARRVRIAERQRLAEAGKIIRKRNFQLQPVEFLPKLVVRFQKRIR